MTKAQPSPATTWIRFERGRDGVIGPTYGPYDFIQVTYDLVRASRDDNETELAMHGRIDGDWYLIDKKKHPETVFSDMIVWSDTTIVARSPRRQKRRGQ